MNAYDAPAIADVPLSLHASICLHWQMMDTKGAKGRSDCICSWEEWLEEDVSQNVMNVSLANLAVTPTGQFLLYWEIVCVPLSFSHVQGSWAILIKHNSVAINLFIIEKVKQREIGFGEVTDCQEHVHGLRMAPNLFS